MKIEKIKETDERISFLVKDADFSFMNAIRRSIFEIPVLAFDTIEFYKNDSALYDEILAHRIGLVPLKAPKSFTRKEECSCEGKGCMKCTTSFKLKAKGPGTVYSSELKGKGANIIYKDMPLVILDKDQELEFSADATLGTGKEHSKFSPGLAWFNSFPEITIKGCDGCSKCINVCPKKAISMKGKEITIDPMKCDMCEACVDVCKELKDAIKINPSQGNFIFTIEAFGQLEPRDIFIESIKTLDSNLKQIEKEVK